MTAIHPNPYRFESLGSNCEFGFYQTYRGHHVSTLFKWAGYPNLCRLRGLFDADFVDLLIEKNSVPFNREVSFDLSYGIGWHAPFATELIDEQGSEEMGNLAFSKGSDWTLAWLSFQKRMQFLISDFRSTISKVSKILVLKDVENVSDEEIVILYRSLQCLGARASLMIVRLADDVHPAGHYRALETRLIIVWIARFAPGHHVQTFCAASWDQACRTAISMFDAEAAKP